MSHSILLEELRRTGEQKAQALRERAEAEIAEYRTAAQQKFEQETSRCGREHEQACADTAHALLLDARTEARRLRSDAERSMADRLYRIARRSVHRLRTGAYSKVFEALVHELPDCPWQTVRVNPSDQALARDFFENADIIVDSTIAGGMEVENKEKTLKVINTFEKRLEKAWPEMLPALMQSLHQELDAS